MFVNKGKPIFFVLIFIYLDIENFNKLVFAFISFPHLTPDFFVISKKYLPNLYGQYFGNFIWQLYFSSLFSINVLFNPFSQSLHPKK